MPKCCDGLVCSLCADEKAALILQNRDLISMKEMLATENVDLKLKLQDANRLNRELTEDLSMKAFLAARKLPGITDAMAYAVRDAVLGPSEKRICDCGADKLPIPAHRAGCSAKAE